MRFAAEATAMLQQQTLEMNPSAGDEEMKMSTKRCIAYNRNTERRNNVTLLIQAKLFVNMESQRNADNRHPTMPTIE